MSSEMKHTSLDLLYDYITYWHLRDLTSSCNYITSAMTTDQQNVVAQSPDVPQGRKRFIPLGRDQY